MLPSIDAPLEWFPWRVAGDPALIRLTPDKDAMTTRRAAAAIRPANRDWSIHNGTPAA